MYLTSFQEIKRLWSLLREILHWKVLLPSIWLNTSYFTMIVTGGVNINLSFEEASRDNFSVFFPLNKQVTREVKRV